MFNEAPWPQPLQEGDAISVAAPSGPFSEERFQRGLAVLHKLGFKVLAPKGLRARRGFLAGSDAHRLEGLIRALRDPRSKAVIAARGGYGAMRLLPDLAKIWPQAAGKALIGFSDLTAIHLARLAAGGPVGYHAPMITSLADTDEAALADFKTGLLKAGAAEIVFRGNRVLYPGTAQGPVLGGNLTIFCHLLATPYLPDLAGAILALEDVGESPYRLDRLLTAIRLSGQAGRLAGLAFGAFANCGPEAGVDAVLEDFARRLRKPVLSGLAFGHHPANHFLPLGSWAELSAGPDNQGRLVFMARPPRPSGK